MTHKHTKGIDAVTAELCGMRKELVETQTLDRDNKSNDNIDGVVAVVTFDAG